MSATRIVLFLLSLSLAITVSGKDGVSTKQNQDTITIVASNLNPPLSYLDENQQPCGFDVDIIKEIMRRIKQPYRIILMPWSNCVDAVSRHQADVIFGMKFDSQRTKDFKFGPTIYYTFICTAHRKEKTNTRTLESLEKYAHIGVIKKSVLQEILDSCHPPIKYIGLERMSDAINGLKNGNLDAIVTYNTVAEYALRKYNVNFDMEISDLGLKPIENQVAGIDQTLINKISRTYYQMKMDGFYDETNKKWFSEEPLNISKYVYWGLTILAISVIVSASFNYMLRKEVKKARKQIERSNEDIRESAERMDMAMNASNMALWEISSTTMLTTCYNSPIDRLNEISIPFNELISFAHPDDVPALMPYKDIIATGKDAKINMEVRLKYPSDNKWHYCNIIGKTFRRDNFSNRVTSYVGFSIDVTYLKDVQKKLEIEKEKAQTADKLKSEFLANMSHEIRTPLNAIVGFSDILRSTITEEERNLCYNIIDKNSKLLLQLINDILDLSKMESGMINLNNEHIDLEELFEASYDTLSQMNSKSESIEFINEAPHQKCIIYADANRIQQIISNFVTNAFKYTESGYVKMGYKCVDNGIRIYVKDSGIGISPDKQALVFSRFEKLGSFVQGTGLGLAICKSIADCYNGKIGVISTEGKGSTFWAWIPTETTITHYDQPLES
jgi:ABC-type amino acid transport substrate-binding protein/nitrogen-specific signal transduction histidine kinase